MMHFGMEAGLGLVEVANDARQLVTNQEDTFNKGFRSTVSASSSISCEENCVRPE